MRVLLAALLALLALPPLAAQQPPVQFSIPKPSDWVHIDGAKNPELIPEWSVWKHAFVVFALGSDLPWEVGKHLSNEEAAAVRATAAQHQKDMAACEQKGLKLKPLLATESAAVINLRTQEINLECRWQTLRRRDHVLESLRPDAQVALRQWVEGIKAGIQVSVPKAELDFYLKPK